MILSITNSDMKRFIKNVTIYLIILLIIISSVEVIFRRNNKLDDDGTLIFNSIPDKIQICNFGSSHGQLAFNYSEYEKKYACFNFGLSRQTLSYDYRILKNYKDKIESNGVVFIVVSYFSFSGKETETYDFESKNKRYYKILKPENIKEYDLATDIYMNYTSLDTGVNNLLKSLINRSEINYGQEQRMNHETNKAEVLEMLYKDYPETQIEINTNNNVINNINYDQEEMDSLIAMINLIKEIGATPIMITTPLTIEFNNVYGNDFIETFENMMKKIAYENNISYYNYGNDPRFVENYSYFFDYHHLNNKGSLFFTKIVFEEILKNYGF